MIERNMPLLRDRAEKKAVVSNTELLFDLIYVFAVTQLSHYLLHHLNWLGLVQQMVLWFGIWMVWQHTAWVTNWFNPDHRSMRMMLFLLMVIGLIMTAALPEAYADKGLIFAICYVVIQIVRPAYVLLSIGKDHALAANYRRILGWASISGLLWITGALHVGNERLAYWVAAVLCDYISPMFGFYLPGLGRSNPRQEWTVEGHHLAERLQLFVMIAFGETIVMSGASLSEKSQWSIELVAAAIISFIGSLAMWWIYFDTSSEAGSRKIHEAENPGWLGLKFYAIHVILIGSLIICAVGDELVVSEPWGEVGAEAMFTLLVGPSIYLIANMIYKWIVCRCVFVSHPVALLCLAILILFAPHFNLLALNASATAILILLIMVDYKNPRSIGSEKKPAG